MKHEKIILHSLLLFTFFVSAQSITHKASFKQGQQLERHSVTTMTMGMDMMGQPINVQMENIMTTLVVVDQTSGTDVTLSSTARHIIFCMAGNAL